MPSQPDRRILDICIYHRLHPLFSLRTPLVIILSKNRSKLIPISARRSLPIDRYKVSVVCAFPHGMTAATAILDERHQQMAAQDKLDNNNYVQCRMLVDCP